MHAAYGQTAGEEDLATFHNVVPFPPAAVAWEPGGRYDSAAGRRPSLSAIVAVAAFHAVLLFALISLDVIPLHRKKEPPLVVELVAEPPAPPPAPPEVKPQPDKPVVPQIMVPQPVVRVPDPPPAPVTVTNQPPPPPQAVVISDAPPRPAAPAGPVSAVDLSSTVLSMVRPRIPLESRRRREGGTVYVLVTLGLDGRVESASLSRSSGSPRLDDAVLEAVRRWRWSPTRRNGEAVRVRGVVDVTIAPPA